MGNDNDLAGTLRVLAVNHNDIFREGVRIFMEAQANVQLVGSVADAGAAVVLFVETRPDLTLVDLDLPLNGGISAIRRMREIDRDAWIIGLVTYEWDDRVQEALAAGASAVLSKDLISDGLMPLIRSGPRVSQHVEPARRSRLRWRTYVRAFLLHGNSKA